MARQILTVGLLSPLVRGGGHSRVVAGGVQGDARWAREVLVQRQSERLSFGVMAPEMAGAVRRCGGGRTCLVRRCARDVLVRSECRDVQTTRDHTFSGASRQLRF